MTLDRHRAVLLALALALTPLTTLRLYAADEIQYFAYLRSLVFDRDLDFENEYRWFVERDPAEYAPFAATFLGPKTPAGLPPNNAPIGSAVLWAPLYVPTVLVEALAGGGSIPPGYSRADVAAVCIASMLWGVAGLFLVDAACRRFASRGAALAATVLTWLGSNLLFYVYVTPPMSHSGSFFAVALLLWLWLRAGPGWKSALGLGLAAGLAATLRLQDVLWALVPLSAPLLGGEVRDRAGLLRWLRWSAVFAAGLLAAFTPQLLVWEILNGSLTPFGVVPVRGRFALGAPYLAGVLFSSFHGILTWTPILVPAFVGLGALAARDGRGRALVLGVAAEIWLLSGYVVAFGHGFGQRLFVSSLPAAAIGLAFFAERLAPRLPRAATIAGAVLCVWWNLSLMVQHGTGMIPRNDGVPFSTLVRNQLVEVPARIPRVLGRYVFDRGSLYHADPMRSSPTEAPRE